jgi:hypothetical protein
LEFARLVESKAENSTFLLVPREVKTAGIVPSWSYFLAISGIPRSPPQDNIYASNKKHRGGEPQN